MFYIISVVGYLLQVIRYSCVRSNIVQFNIDQEVGASDDKLSAIIYWHSLSVPAIFFIVIIGECLRNQFVIVSYILSGVAVSTVIITNFLRIGWILHLILSTSIPGIVLPLPIGRRITLLGWT